MHLRVANALRKRSHIVFQNAALTCQFSSAAKGAVLAAFGAALAIVASFQLRSGGREPTFLQFASRSRQWSRFATLAPGSEILFELPRTLHDRCESARHRHGLVTSRTACTMLRQLQ